MEEIQKPNPLPDDDEIDLVEVAKRLWKGRKVIGIFVLVFLLLGGIWLGYKSFIVIPEYTSKVLIYIDTPKPEVVPTLVNGSAFLGEMMNVLLTDPVSGRSLTVKEALDTYHKPPQGSLAGFGNRINTVSTITGTFEISVTLQQPAMAQQLADSIAERFSGFLVGFALQRNSQSMNSLENRYREADAAYRQSLTALSDFYRLNSGSAAQRDTIAEKRMRAESDIRYDVLSELAIQIEKEQIKKQTEMPVINIIEQASVATQSNRPNAVKTLTFMLLLGMTVGVFWILGKDYIQKLRSAGDRGTQNCYSETVKQAD